MKISISVDMDTLEDYARFYRIHCPIGSDFYYQVIPHFLELFNELSIKATFFVIGRDAKNSKLHPLLREIVHWGHEIGNHSMTHKNRFRSLNFQAKEKEIVETSERIQDVTGFPVVGFRAPAYDFDSDILRILIERGFDYDSSINPTLMKPAIKLLSMWWAKRFTVGQGSFTHCFYNVNPHFLHLDNGQKLLEFPISVVPGIRFPFFGTMMLKLGREVFDRCCHQITQKKVPIVVYELHAIELFDFTKYHELHRFKILPGFLMSRKEKYEFLKYCLSELLNQRRAMTLQQLASSFKKA